MSSGDTPPSFSSTGKNVYDHQADELELQFQPTWDDYIGPLLSFDHHDDLPRYQLPSRPAFGHVTNREFDELGQPPYIGAMIKVAVSQTSDGVNPYSHLKGPSLCDVNQRAGSSHVGAWEIYGAGGQPPSVGAMTKVVVSQASQGVDIHNHPQEPSFSDVGSSQKGTPDQEIVRLQELELRKWRSLFFLFLFFSFWICGFRIKTNATQPI